MKLYLAGLSLALTACAYWAENGGAEPKSATSTTGADSSQSTAKSTTPVRDASDDTMRMLGSSTIGASLAPHLAQAYLAHLGATDAAVHEEGKKDNHIRVTGTVGGKAKTIEIDYPGSGAGFVGLAEGRCEVAMSSRPIRGAEADKLRALGDMSSPGAEHVLAMDGIAVIVNKANRINALTVEQIGGIFSGKKAFGDVGGSGTVHIYTRDKSSGTYDAFKDFALGGKEIDPSAKVMDDNESVSASVSSDEAGIGFVGLPFVKDAKAVAVQDGDAAPQSATPLSVSTEDYPLSRRLFLYTAENARKDVVDFVNFAQSDDGQKVVAKDGFIELSTSPVSASIPAGAPDEYRKAVDGASRLPFNVRFRPGTSTLDAKARSDVARAARAAASRGGASRSLVLLGFADKSGAEPQNVELSRVRARAVADQLKGLGLDAKFDVLGLGSALPVAPNDTPEGRERNRRVEVWIR